MSKEVILSNGVELDSDIESNAQTSTDSKLVDWRTLLNSFALSNSELKDKIGRHYKFEKVEFSPQDLDEMKECDRLSLEFNKHYFDFGPDNGEEIEKNNEQQKIIEGEKQYREEINNKIKNLLEPIQLNLDKCSIFKDNLDTRQFELSIALLTASMPNKEQRINSINDLETVYDGDTSRLDKWFKEFEIVINDIKNITTELAQKADNVEKLENEKLHLEEQRKIISKSKLKVDGLKGTLMEKIGIIPNDIKENRSHLLAIEGKLKFLDSDLSAEKYIQPEVIGRYNDLIEKAEPIMKGFSECIEWAKKNPREQEIKDDLLSEFILVRTTNQKPTGGENGPMIEPLPKDSKKLPSNRMSVHYTLNAPVFSHPGGSWGKESFIYLSPLRQFIELNGKPAKMNQHDTWFLGNSILPRETVLLAKSGIELFKLPAKERSSIKIIVVDNPYQECEKDIEKMGYKKEGQQNFISKINQLNKYGATKSEYNHETSYFSRRIEVSWNKFLEFATKNDPELAIEGAIEFIVSIKEYESKAEESTRIDTDKVVKTYKQHLMAVRKCLDEQPNALELLENKQQGLIAKKERESAEDKGLVNKIKKLSELISGYDGSIKFLNEVT